MTLPEEAQKRILELEQQVNGLQQQLAIAKKNAVTDPLTGIFNRRVLEKELNFNLADTDRSYFDLVVVEIDLDHFKEVNDLYGHPQGDTILKEFTKLVQQTLRDTDIFGRWGGEEFLLILPIPHHTPVAEIEKFFRRLQSNIYKINRSNKPQEDHLGLTFSAGAVIVEAGRKKVDLERVLNQADSALYESKKIRNTFVLKKYIED
jgi:diguanylate cyclase (GGDEF)-like protein